MQTGLKVLKLVGKAAAGIIILVAKKMEESIINYLNKDPKQKEQ